MQGDSTGCSVSKRNTSRPQVLKQVPQPAAGLPHPARHPACHRPAIRYPYGYRHVYPHGHGNRPARLPVSRRSRGHRLAHAHHPQRIPPRVAQILCARLLVHASVRLRGLLLSGYGGEPRYTRGGCGFLYACSQHQVGRHLRRVQRYCRCHLPGRRSCRSWRIRRLTSWCAR